MSDPTDMAALGTHLGTGAGGAAIVGFLLKFLMGGALKGIEDQLDSMKEAIADARAATKESLMELKADTREAIQGLKDQLERSERRHDSTIGDLAMLRQSSLAMHSRLDEYERRLETLERR